MTRSGESMVAELSRPVGLEVKAYQTLGSTKREEVYYQHRTYYQ